jgi:hypothetical protein
MILVIHVACTGRDGKCMQSLVENPERKQPVRRLRHRWEDNIKTKLQEIKRESIELIHLAQNRGQRQALVNMVMNVQVP